MAADDQKRFALSMTLNAIKKTTVDTFAKESLRYDTQSNDTNFFFFNTGKVLCGLSLDNRISYFKIFTLTAVLLFHGCSLTILA